MWWLVLALFFVSGINGLVFETVWFRQLALLFGAHTFAQATILAAFLGGLGLGAYLASLLGDRIKRPFFVYGLLEGALGLYALALPFLLGRLGPELGGLAESVGGYGLARSASIFLVLLPATLAMGATLPLLVRLVTTRHLKTGTRLGLLYGVNTLGAFGGALLAGFWLLPALGQSVANRLAAFSAIVVALIAISLSRTHSDFEERCGENGEDAPGPPPSTLRWFVVSLFLVMSGLGSLWLQTAATRLLTLILGAAVYSFTLTLAATLAAIGLGALLFALLARRKKPGFGLLAFSQSLIVLGVLLLLVLLTHLPQGLALAQSYGGTPGDWLLWQAALVVLAVFLPFLGAGLAYPAALALCATDPEGLSRDVGRAGFLNSAGCVLGAFSAVFILIPGSGLVSTLRAAGLLAAFFALLFILFAFSRGQLMKKGLAALTVLVLAQGVFLWPAPDPITLTSGLYRPSLLERLKKEKAVEAPKLLSYADGAAATVSVERRGNVTVLKINGKVEASDYFDMPTQVMVGALPLLAHPRGEQLNAALIGYGSGVTAGTLLRGPAVRRLVAYEIEPSVAAAVSEPFSRVNFEPLNDPRFSLVFSDARHELLRSKERFDLIVSEPSNPWVAGSSALFTTDFYRLVRSRLAADGLFAQWVQLYELSPEHVKALFRSVAEVFPEVQVYGVSERSQDVVLVATNKPNKLNLPQVVARAAAPELREALSRAGLGSGYEALSLLAIAPEDLAAYVGTGPKNTDDNGLLEFAAPFDMQRFRDSTRSVFDFHLDPARGQVQKILGVVGNSDAERGEHLSRLALALASHGRLLAAFGCAQKALSFAPENLIAQDMQRIVELLSSKAENWPPLRNAWLLEEQTDERLTQLALAMSTGANREAHTLAVTLAREKGDPRLALLAGGLALRLGADEDALTWLAPLLQKPLFMEGWPEAWFYYARAQDARMDFRGAIRSMAHFVERERQSQGK